MRILFVTGEASGDLYASGVIRAILFLKPSVEVWAVGGIHCKGAGAKLLSDSSGWGAIGVPEAVKRFPLYIRGFLKIDRFIRGRRPNLLVLVDFGAFNRRVSALARKIGVRRLYYIPPGCWSRSKKVAKRAVGLAEVVVTPLPWSASLLSSLGQKVTHVGHPLLEVVRERRGKRLERHPPDRRNPVIALLPGSREAELLHCLPVMVKACLKILHYFPGAKFVASIAPNIKPERVRGAFPEGIPVSFRLGASEPLREADAAVVVSGTATLEAALWRCSHVCIYRGSPGMSLQYRLLGRGIRFVALPNIVLQRLVVPELLQANANPTRIAMEIAKLILDQGRREEMLHAFEEVESILEGPPASEVVADLILRMARGEKI